MTVDDKIIEKIQKLLNHADGTEIEAEQLAFIEKAQLLMMQHAIDQETLKAYGTVGVETIKTIEIALPGHTPVTNGKRMLLNVCATNNRCRMYSNKIRGAVVGYEADARYAVMLYTHLLAQCEWEMVLAQADLDGEESVRTFQANFIQAFAGKVGTRLRQMNENIADTEEGASMALVLVGRKAEVDQYVDEELNLVSRAKVRIGYSEHGRSAGRAAGERADIAGARGTTGRIEG